MHDRSNFFKYMSANTAEIVLRNSTLRWSSPLLFNDPFDIPRKMLPNISEKDVGAALALRLVEMLETKDYPKETINPTIKYMIDIFEHLYPNGIPEGLITEMRGLKDNPPMGDNVGELISDFRKFWENNISERRILCVSESNDITSMWNHYADGYRGVVIELLCSDELDSGWLVAKKVNYSNVPPKTCTAEGMAELLSMDNQHAVKYLIDTLSFIKTMDWSQEREWRISSFKRKTENGLSSDYKFHEREIGNIYLGPEMEEAKRQEIIELSKVYPNAKVFNTSIGDNMKFIFRPIE